MVLRITLPGTPGQRAQAPAGYSSRSAPRSTGRMTLPGVAGQQQAKPSMMDVLNMAGAGAMAPPVQPSVMPPQIATPNAGPPVAPAPPQTVRLDQKTNERLNVISDAIVKLAKAMPQSHALHSAKLDSSLTRLEAVLGAIDRVQGGVDQAVSLAQEPAQAAPPSFGDVTSRSKIDQILAAIPGLQGGVKDLHAAITAPRELVRDPVTQKPVGSRIKAA